MKYIVVKDPNGGDKAEFMVANARRHTYAINGNTIDWNRGLAGQIAQCTLYECDDVDEKAVIDQISQWHPGKEVLVLTVEKMFQRMPGVLTEKKLTKEGKLPI